MRGLLQADTTDGTPQGSRLALGLLILVWLGFNAPAFAGRVLFPVDLDGSLAESGSPTGEISNPLDADAYTFYYPLRVHLGQRLRSGDIPLWDPHRFAGIPFAANAQAAVWYPPNWTFAFGDSLLTYSWLLILTRLAGLLIAYWFFRVLSLHPLAAAGGAIVFIGSGFIMAWGTHLTFPSTAIWLPLALGGITRVFQGRARSGVPAASAGLGLAILGGHPQLTIFVWLAAVLWTAVWGGAVLLERRGLGFFGAFRKTLPSLSLAGLPFLLGAGVGALQLLGSLDLSNDVVRGAEPYEGLVAAAPPPNHLATLVLPDRFGNPLDGNHVGSVNYTEGAMYAGILTLVLVGVSIWRRRDRMTVAFLTIGVVGFLAAFGTPFFRVLYTLVPGLSRVRGVGRFVFLVDVALAGMAAIGLDRILKTGYKERRAVLVVVALALGSLMASVTLVSVKLISSSYLLPRIVLASSLLVAGGGLLLWLGRVRVPRLVAGTGIVLLLATDLWAFGFPYHPFQYRRPIYSETSLVHHLRSSTEPRPRLARLFYYWLPVNAALPHELYDVQGYDALIPTRYVELVSLIENEEVNARGFNVIYNFSGPIPLDSAIADLLGIRFVLAPNGQMGLGPPLFSGRASIFARPNPLPSAYLVHCWDIVPPDATVSRLATMSRNELLSVGVVDGETGPVSSSRNNKCVPGAPVNVERYEPDTVAVSVVTNRPALLVITDGWDEGWKATVDGVTTPVARVDHALRGVFLESGRHRVELTYRPDWVRPGMGVTIISLAVLAAFPLMAVRRTGSLRKSSASRPSLPRRTG